VADAMRAPIANQQNREKAKQQKACGVTDSIDQ
jgi:hypothetical protein